jgi:putative ABC transport system permease protein
MTIVAVLSVHANAAQQHVAGLSALANPRYQRIDQVLLVLTVTLATLAAVNAVFITQATAADARHSSALARALGATTDQIAGALSLAQLIPALPAVLLGIPAGIALVKAVSHGGSTTVPPAWWLVAMVAGTLFALAVLTVIPARASSRRSVAEVLQSESA